MSDTTAPFAGTRFEYENETEHLFFLPPKLFQPLEEPNPAYLVGSRGSGKTTLLKALNWRERINNRFLKAQLGDTPFDRRYIGIYIRCPHIQLACFDRWLSGQDENFAAEVVSFELDLAWLKALCEAIAELVRRGIINNNAVEESEFVQRLAQLPKVSKCLRTGGIPAPKTLLDVADAFECARSELETAAKLKIRLDQIVSRFPFDQIGDFGRIVSESLQAFCDQHEPEGKHWHFKICLDESECLSPFALKVVNTAIRLSAWPAFFVVSFVRLPEDIVSTFFEKLTHQRADKRILRLDDMSDDEFRQFAQGVASIRIQRACAEYKDDFQLRDLLGTISINRLLATILEESVRARAKELLAMAKALTETEFYQDAIRGAPADEAEEAAEENGDLLPIYQAYLIKHLDLELPSPKDPKWIRRNQDSREIRKKMVAAYLSICAELGTDIRYASAEMVFQLSDKCMRDFLFQMHELYIEVGKPLHAFIQSEIPWKTQDAAIKRASKAKFDSIPNRLTKAPPESVRVIEGFSRLTAMLQSKSPSVQHLSSSERGRFEIDLNEFPASRHLDDYEILTEAAEAGFLKILISEPTRFQFRIHTSLAAHFGCSYRGAYYPTKTTFGDVRKFRDAKTLTSMKDAVDSIAARANTGEDASQFQFGGFL